jgi:glutathione synthase/RimK-type ligase-like ATP-grasp enzyme
VVRELRGRGVPYVRVNTERLADWRLVARPEIAELRIEFEGQVHELDAAQGIWYRRPETPQNGRISALTPSEAELVRAQWRAAIGGLRCLPATGWINPPFLNAAAESKMLQLRMARGLGFRVPATVVTNSREDARQFLRAHPQGVVIKALHAPLIENPELPQFIFTRRLDMELLDSADETESAPFILQEEIRPKRDIRVTVVDDVAFGAVVAEQTESVDWRVAKPRPRFVPYDLPQEVSSRCTALVRALGLRFGALDLLIDSSGEWIFLEINPNGEWGWLQKTCGFPVAGALVDALLRSDG